MRQMLQRSLAVLVLTLALAPVLTLAAATTTGGGTGNATTTGGGTATTTGGGVIDSGVITLPNPLRCDDALCIRNSILTAAKIIGSFVLVIMILWGAFQLLSAGGSPEKIEQGKRTIFYAILGFIVIIVASSVIYVIQGLLNTAAE